MGNIHLNLDALTHIDNHQWTAPVAGFLSDESFKILHKEYPQLGYFVFCPKIDKTWRLHDGEGYSASSRFVLDGTPALFAKLSPAWKNFVTQMTDMNGPYIQKMKTIIDRPFTVTYSWHLSHEGFFLKPHTDGHPKLATHLTYFNTDQDWDESWGGHLQIFTGKREGSHPMWPAFKDFSIATPQPLINNHGHFIRRTPDSWHGVYPITAPRGKYRKHFSIVFEET